jgi:hypothetical protein
MRRRTGPTAASRLLARAGSFQALPAVVGSLLLASLLLCTPPAFASAAFAEAHLRGLKASELSTRADCANSAPGYASCASERLVYKASGSPVRPIPTGSAFPLGSDAPAAGPASEAANPALAAYDPEELQSAYNLTTLAANQGAGETIALVDAYDDPNAASDLAVYRSGYELPECTSQNGCFSKVNQSGEAANYPQPSPSSDDWSIEVSLDLDMASAICPKCKLLLVEAASDSLEDLAAAAHTAATTPGVVAVSNSYTVNERADYPEWTDYASDYAQPGVAFTAAAGDAGYEVNFPAVLSTVTAVGGTSLQLSGGVWSQTAWSHTGAGCSKYVAKPKWQLELGSADEGCSKRTNNDVSADANPETGAIAYDTYNENPGWEVVGGTSEASPIIAAFYALIGQGAGVEGASWDYAHPGFFTDIVGGSDKRGCKATQYPYLCEAVVGYDGPTGLGTPSGSAADPGEPSEAGKSEGSKGGAKEEGSGDSTNGGSGDGGSGGSSGGSSGGGSSGGGSSDAGAAAPTNAISPAATSTPPANASSSSTIRISALALTPRALVALNGDRPRAFQVGFAFTINLAARVRVVLAKRVRIRGHERWKPLRDSLTIAAAKGRNSRHLRGHNVLAPGSYQLTLAPAHGSARSIVFQIG